MTRATGRASRRALATLAVVAVATPLVALPSGPAAAAGAAVYSGRSTLDPSDDCDKNAVRYNDQTPPALAQLGARNANLVATGKDVKVAVVDSGVDADNKHFPPGSVLPGVDLSGDGQPNGQKDIMGHGTAIAGEIAARPYPGSAVVGLAPDATILPIRVYTKTISGDDTSTVDDEGNKIIRPTAGSIAAGIQAAAMDGAKIINVSLSTDRPDGALEEAVKYAVSRGALVVASAGNRNTSENKTDVARYPAAYPDVLAVAATDSRGIVTDDSIHGSYVDVAAPGVDIITTFFAAGDCQFAPSNGDLQETASTSYATGYVSAAAALIAQAHPTETPAQWRYRLEVTALRPRPDSRDDLAGWGVIQPYEALTFVSDGTALGPQDPAVPPSATPTPAPQQIAPAVQAVADHTTRDQTLWLTLGGVVAVLVLALVALLRRDRRKKRPDALSPPRSPAGVR